MSNHIDPEDQKAVASTGAMIQYIEVNTRPDVYALVQLVAPCAEETTLEEYKILKKVILHVKETPEQVLILVKVNMETAKLVRFTDNSVANARDLKCHFGFIVILADHDGRANILQYGSNRCRHVTRSVITSEPHAVVPGFNFAHTMQHLQRDGTGHTDPTEAYVAAKRVFDVIDKYGRTMERQFQIDIGALNETYEKGELARLVWIPSTTNPAEALTKIHVSKGKPIAQLMVNNHVDPKPVG